MKDEHQTDDPIERDAWNAINACFASFDDCVLEYFTRGGKPAPGREAEARLLVRQQNRILRALDLLMETPGDVRPSVANLSRDMARLNRALVDCLPGEVVQ